MTDQEKGAIQESILAGKAPAIIKRRASRGTLPVSKDELLEILIFLTKDHDPTCSEVHFVGNIPGPGVCARRSDG